MSIFNLQEKILLSILGWKKKNIFLRPAPDSNHDCSRQVNLKEILMENFEIL